MKEVNEERILEIFEELLNIYSPSKGERDVASYIIKFLEGLGAELYLDHCEDKYGGNAPVIFSKLKGELDGEGVTLSCHMDVVEPNKNLKIVKTDGIWRSDGTTTLGADDKAGVAAVLYTLECAVNNNLPHRDIYAVFTPGEEMGMLGARNINWDEVYKHMKPAKNMIVADNGGPSRYVAYQAPTAYHFICLMHGKKAHAGLAPEKGINAIQLASRAISEMNIGRIDKLTTSNISTIRANEPTNVVPDCCEFFGEVRAHEDERAREVLKSYEAAAKKYDADAEFNMNCEYPRLCSKDDLKFVNEFVEAYKAIGVDAVPQIIGGGSDANFFAKEGFNSVIIGVGMENPHTTEEYCDIREMFIAAKVMSKYIFG